MCRTPFFSGFQTHIVFAGSSFPTQINPTLLNLRELGLWQKQPAQRVNSLTSGFAVK
jgi:hypothetical protein